MENAVSARNRPSGRAASRGNSVYSAYPLIRIIVRRIFLRQSSDSLLQDVPRFQAYSTNIGSSPRLALPLQLLISMETNMRKYILSLAIALLVAAASVGVSYALSSSGNSAYACATERCN